MFLFIILKLIRIIKLFGNKLKGNGLLMNNISYIPENDKDHLNSLSLTEKVFFYKPNGKQFILNLENVEFKQVPGGCIITAGNTIKSFDR